MRAKKPPGKKPHMVVGDLCHSLEISLLSGGDVVHLLQSLRADLGASVALEAAHDLGKEAQKGSHVRRKPLNVIDRLRRWIKRNLGQIHPIFYASLTGEPDIEAKISGLPINRGTGAAETPPTAHTTNQPVACIFHCFEDC